MNYFKNKDRGKSIQQPLLVVIIIFFLGAGFSSCSGSIDKHADGKTITQSEQKVQINWIGHWLGEGDKENLVKEVANEYEFLNQNVQVNLKFPEEVYGGGGYPDVGFVAEQIRKPVPDWDIVRLYGYFPDIAKELNDPNWTDKYLVDFSKVPGFIESHKDFMKNKIYQNRFGGKFFSPYSEGQIAALYVNLDVAKKIGINVKQFDMTFDDFLGYIKATYDYNENNPYVVPIFDYNWGKSNTIFNILFYSLMDDLDEILETVLTEKKLQAIEKCFKALEELSVYNPIEANWVEREWSSENDFILRDSCLFFPNFTFMYGIWKKNAPEKLNKVIPCEFPVFKASSGYSGGYTTNWAVLKNSPHRDEAIKLMMYWCNPSVAEKWVRYSKSPSGVKGNFTASSFGVDPFENYSYVIENKYDENFIKDEDKQYILGSANMDIDLKVQDIMLGKLTAAEAMKELKSKASISN